MSKHDKVLNALFADPVRANIAWTHIVALFISLGAEVEEAEGSRVLITLEGQSRVFHRPHPQKEVKKYVVRSVREFLTETGFAPEAEPEPEPEA